MRSKLKALLARVEAFANAEKPSSPGGGYAPVEETEIEELDEIIEELIRLKYKPDADGDVPVQFRLVDRTRFERSFFFAIPYTHGAKRAADYDEPIQNATANVLFAAKKLEMLHDLRRRLAKREAPTDNSLDLIDELIGFAMVGVEETGHGKDLVGRARKYLNDNGRKPS